MDLLAQRRNGRERNVTENDIAERIVEAAFRVHWSLGPGLLESVYEVALAWELYRTGNGLPDEKIR